MKKKAIFTIVACSIAALFLTAVLAVGLAGGGFGPGSFDWRAESAAAKPGTANQYEYTWDPAETEVTGLDVEWIDGTVDLKVGSGSVIRITESADRRLKENEKLKLSCSGGTLKIKWKDELISLSLFQNGRKNLTVEVPEEVAEGLEELECTTASGKITASGFTARVMDFTSTSGELDLSGLSGEEGEISSASGAVTLKNAALSGRLAATTTSGSLKLEEVRSEETELESVSGAVSYSGKASRFKADSISAAVRAEFTDCPEKVEMESVSGSLTVAIPENDGFEVKYDSISGKFSSDFPFTTADSSSVRSGRALYSSGKASFQFSTTSGDMLVLKR